MKIAIANTGANRSQEFQSEMNSFFNVNFFDLNDQNLSKAMSDSSYELMIFDFPENFDVFGYCSQFGSGYLDRKVIVLKNDPTSEEVIKCLDAGVEDFLRKPVSFEVLKEVILSKKKKW